MSNSESESPKFDLEAYEREVASHAQSESDLNALVQNLKSGDQAGKLKLIQAALWIPLKVAKQYSERFPGWSIGDVIESANFGLFMAAENLSEQSNTNVAQFISERIEKYLQSLK